jgi:ABC-type polar amino acid transport system ATPase subunit
MIDVKGLVRRHPGAERAALQGVDLTVEPGRLAAVVGKSGAGKSTLLRCLVGLEPFDGGEVRVNGTIARAGESALLLGKVGLVSQSFDLFPHLTVLANCALAPAAVKGESHAAAQARATALLASLGLGDRGGAFPEQLSGGQRQRVAIARALAMEPRVLVYDEPTSALDAELKGEVRRTLLEVKASGVTQLVVTHDVALARDAAEWVFVLEAGRVIAQGLPGEVLR